ncbi:hypothetical protein ACKVWC_011583 [Pyricularia oryzae]|nr:hypothetical protein MCOR19_003225 [Pyricularia oryzae]KAI6338234.1 hypothetical protein MCOR28_008112 [Pyricularia oryzae]KAI6377074.1 hypothetical protein MCOR31_001332 [Pyricularia oryzae]KAI6396792.1 hypothetical protein MCOR20_009777 [Pyricularia oryzae]KAI6433722.1 hypothetical protein MCOR21_002675 [Pyricularia oryzae]
MRQIFVSSHKTNCCLHEPNPFNMVPTCPANTASRLKTHYLSPCLSVFCRSTPNPQTQCPSAFQGYMIVVSPPACAIKQFWTPMIDNEINKIKKKPGWALKKL